jgi:glycosyltransferase involved in cell wall biosynthesis
MADILFVHNNFPGQLGFIAESLRGRGHRCAAIGSETAKGIEGVALRRWRTTKGTTPGILNLAVRAEADLIRGRAAADCALALREQGFAPKLIIGHPGWGETLLLREVWPDARVILHGEFYYRTRGADVGFDPEFGEMTQEEQFRVAAKNATMAMAYAEADRIVSPTAFQASLLPAAVRDKVAVIHEGVDVQKVRPDPQARIVVDGITLDRSTPVVTYINRHMEPLRGFHIFMRALPRLMEQVPDAHAVIIGADGTGGYGGGTKDKRTWRQIMMDEVGERLDPARLHFTGRLPYDEMLAALSVSAAHVYYTYPFVLSWSLLEAMASGCAIIASDTAPVRDAIVDGQNGRLRDFFDPAALADAAAEACLQPERFQAMRKAARATVLDRFDRRSQCLPAWLRLIDQVLAS